MDNSAYVVLEEDGTEVGNWVSGNKVTVSR
jgi:hypothetical protein